MTTETTTIDASEYLDVLEHVVRNMSLPSYLRDEAYSEGLVALVKACDQLYKKDSGVPIGAFLRRELRYALLNWQRKEFKQKAGEIPVSHAVNPELDAPFILAETVAVAERELTYSERTALFGALYGFQNWELSKALKVNGLQLADLQATAKVKLNQAMGQAFA